MNITELTKEIINGRRLTRDDDLSFFETADLEELAAGANEIRQALCGNAVDLCTIINGRAGKCSENCKFCAQSSFHHTSCETYGMLDTDVVLADCQAREAAGVHAYSIVTAGRTVEGDDLEKLIHTYEELRKNSKLRLCASHGLLAPEAFFRLRNAGVTCIMQTSKHPDATFQISVPHILTMIKSVRSNWHRQQDSPSVPAALSAWVKHLLTDWTWQYLYLSLALYLSRSMH